MTAFRPGDEVYGDNLALMGGFAEFAIAAESSLVAKPAELTFARASAIPQAGAIAVKGTSLAAPGGRVLVNGAGGGSGAFAIQLLKRLGAHVTGVDNAAKLDFMRSVGADEVVDYRAEDFTRVAHASTSSSISSRTARCSPTGARYAPGGTYQCVEGRSGRCSACSRRDGWLGGSPVARWACSSCRRVRRTSPHSPTST